MNEDQIKSTIRDAETFIKRAKAALADTVEFEYQGKLISRMSIGKKSGALRRASLDLTRALADMRRP